MRFGWLKFPRRTAQACDSHDSQLSGPSEFDRRQALAALSAVAGGGALAALPQSAASQDSPATPKRALTGRDANGKSVFKSFEVTSKVVNIDSNPGLTFYENYITEGVPQLTGQEADPMLKGTRDFPPPRRHPVPPDLLSSQAARRLQAAAGRHLRIGLAGIVGKGARHGRSFRARQSGLSHHRHHRLWRGGQGRNDARARRRSKGPSSSGRLRDPERHKASPAQSVAGTLPDGLCLGRRQAGGQRLKLDE
jgi:hypothetical protein